MTSDSAVMERLRAANPVAQVTPEMPELWLSIVSSPGDPRLIPATARAHRARRWRQRARGHRGALLACGVLIAACSSAGVAKVTGIIDPFAWLAHDKALALFRAAPGYDAGRQPAVVPASVRLVESVAVPGVGKVQYWTARTVKGWACAAFKLPDGAWAGTSTAASERYGFGGAVPGCHGPWITWEGPDFRYDSIWLGLNHRPYGLVYGTVSATVGASEVRDLASRATAHIVGGGHFALLIPARHYRIAYVHLEVVDARGHVVAVAPLDHVTFGP